MSFFCHVLNNLLVLVQRAEPMNSCGSFRYMKITVSLLFYRNAPREPHLRCTVSAQRLQHLHGYSFHEHFRVFIPTL